ncbi:DNA topoisomerase IB [Nocardioides sp. GXZ039]|uniref:DNA topoisomerase IB n=1 Tax=Nocardioides sp. GXZ039 TaxID=3136018 RepID=UPI0030F3ACBD
MSDEQSTRVHRVVPGVDPGITRVRTKTGFDYLGPDGKPVDKADRARCEALVLPPAWTEVWISVDPDGHIQAVGTDEAGREQYRYHGEWKQHRAHVKFGRMLQLASALPHARGRVTHDLHHGDPKSQVLGVGFRILDEGSPRVGSIQYLEKYGSRGLTTLLRKHATVEEKVVTLSFPAKEHTHDLIHLHDHELAEVIDVLVKDDQTTEEDRLLSYLTGAGHRAGLDAAEINQYIRQVTGGRFTAKDFRTIRGTLAAATSLAHTGPAANEKALKKAEVEATKAASDALCNTPAVARSSYIDPRVFEQYADGRTIALGGSPDAALLDLVGL